VAARADCQHVADVPVQPDFGCIGSAEISKSHEDKSWPRVPYTALVAANDTSRAFKSPTCEQSSAFRDLLVFEAAHSVPAFQVVWSFEMRKVPITRIAGAKTGGASAEKSDRMPSPATDNEADATNRGDASELHRSSQAQAGSK
jgi:hypothetical protein